MFIILINYTKPVEEVNAVLADHRAYLDTLYAQNKLICSGRKNPLTGGVLLSNAKSRVEIDEIIKNDPYNIKGVADYEVIEFTPGKYHEKFKEFVE
ncbi:MAG: GTP cyclohydrolase [Bacteroidetes bacterium]|nr:GTP cyclohydrolase [Bacteroidota bacterium]